MKTQEVIDYFSDKSVLILGNSVEMMDHEMGEWIDSHDIVCRCGRGINLEDKFIKAIGKKTDVWFTGHMRSAMYSPKVKYDSLKDISMILFWRGTKNYELLYDMPDNLIESGIAYDMYTHDECVEWMRSYGSVNGEIDSIRPSMGLCAIKYLVEEVQSYKKLTIYGFDFFRKYTRNPNPDPAYHLMPIYSWHMPKAGVQIHPHDHEKEVSYVNQCVDQGLLEWKMMSDLNVDKITKTKYGNY
jgi:hypothetical protein